MWRRWKCGSARRLFHRSTRGVTPTEVGLAYYERCKRIAQELEDADNLATLMQEGVGGRLRISTSVAFGRRVMTPLVLDFMRAQPGLQVDLSFDDRYVNLVEQGVDVAIRMGALADSALGVALPGPEPVGAGGGAGVLGRTRHAFVAGRPGTACRLDLQHRAERRTLAFQRRRQSAAGNR